MKTLKTLHKLAFLVLISALFVSCGNNNNDNPYQNALGTGAYTSSGNPIVNNTADLKAQLQARVATDLTFLQSGGRLACQYACPERQFIVHALNSNKCVRIFEATNGQVGFKTYNRNSKIWQGPRDIDAIIGEQRQEPNLTGVVTPSMFDSYFSGTTQNMQLQTQQLQFPDMGLITIYITPTPFGLWPFSVDIPAGANVIPNKDWCAAQQ